jgi:preprotein translocase SecE subunit
MMAETKEKSKKTTAKTTKKVAKANPVLSFLKTIGGAIKAFFGFFKDAFKELESVEWLTPKQTFKFTGYILIVLIGLAVLIALLDTAFFNLFKFVANA